jgi:hypothetical protein
MKPLFLDRAVRIDQPRYRAVRRISVWRSTLVLGAILSLTISVATRFSTTAPSKTSTKVVRSESPNSERQRLLNDGLLWCAPAMTSALFEPAGVSLEILPAVPAITRSHFEDLLFSRPPPSR